MPLETLFKEEQIGSILISQLVYCAGRKTIAQLGSGMGDSCMKLPCSYGKAGLCNTGEPANKHSFSWRLPLVFGQQAPCLFQDVAGSGSLGCQGTLPTSQIFAEEAVSSFPKNKNLALRLAGCYLNLSRIEEGLNLLNPSSLNASEKTSFIKLFPNYGKLISDM